MNNQQKTKKEGVIVLFPQNYNNFTLQNLMCEPKISDKNYRL